VIDFTQDDSDDDGELGEEERGAIALVFKGISGKLKNKKKTTVIKKKIEEAATYEDWVRRMLKITLSNEDHLTLERYATLMWRVAWITKHQSWAVGREYVNSWIDQDRKNLLLIKKGKEVELANPEHLDQILYITATAKARKSSSFQKAATKELTATTPAPNYQKYPCENCRESTHWAHKCPHPCRWCSQMHNSKKCSKRPAGQASTQHATQSGGQAARSHSGQGSGSSQSGAAASGHN
jgi:hypothetical protein